MGAFAFTFPILPSSWYPQRSPQKPPSCRCWGGPVGPGQVWGFVGAPSLPAGTTYISLHVPTMVQLKLENTEQPFLASCNFVLALYCSKNSFYFILTLYFLQNNQYTQNFRAWEAAQEWALLELRVVWDEKDLTITLRKVIRHCLGFLLVFIFFSPLSSMPLSLSC